MMSNSLLIAEPRFSFFFFLVRAAIWGHSNVASMRMMCALIALRIELLGFRFADWASLELGLHGAVFSSV